MAPSGLYFRYSFNPGDGGRVLTWSSASGCAFDWQDSDGDASFELADKFEVRFPEPVSRGRGVDEAYVHWYEEMLKLTAPDGFVIFYADYDVPSLCVVGVPGVRSIRPPLRRR